MINIIFSYDQTKDKKTGDTLLSSIDFIIKDTDAKTVQRLIYNKDKDQLVQNIQTVRKTLEDCVTNNKECQITSVAYTPNWITIFKNVLKLPEETYTTIHHVNLFPILEFLDKNPIAYKHEKLWLKVKRLFKDQTVESTTPNIELIENIIEKITRMKLWMGEKGFLLG